MKTEKINNCPLKSIYDTLTASLKRRVDVRHKSADKWIEDHASGTLRKNKRIGMDWKSQYNTERLAYEFGWCFESLPSNRVNFGNAITAGDCSAITEAGWHAERIMSMDVFGDTFQVKYIHAQGGSGKNVSPDAKREGLGIIVRTTSYPFVMQNHLVFAFIALLDTETGKWVAENPC